MASTAMLSGSHLQWLNATFDHATAVSCCALDHRIDKVFRCHGSLVCLNGNKGQIITKPYPFSFLQHTKPYLVQPQLAELAARTGQKRVWIIEVAYQRMHIRKDRGNAFR